MPDHLFTIAARGHSVDAQSNTVTLFSVLEGIQGEGLPLSIPEFSVITFWRRCAGEEGVSFVQQTRLISPSGNEVFTADASWRFEKVRHRLFLTVNGVAFAESGCYKLKVSIQREGEQTWTNVAEYPIEVAAASETSQEQLFNQEEG